MQQSGADSSLRFRDGRGHRRGLETTGTKAVANAACALVVTFTAMAARPCLANWRQRCTTLALMPCAIATLATDAPGASHSHLTWAWNSAL